jgi:Protein of unknown function (DUF4038)/Domain of unknown function (DUF5060)
MLRTILPAFVFAIAAGWCVLAIAADPPRTPRLGLYEVTLQAEGTYANPYSELTAEAELTPPEVSGKPRRVPLFWDGGSSWKFRFSPDQVGVWKWSVKSRDAGLNGKSGSFEVVTSKQAGSIRPMKDFPRHFERQDGSPSWFLGETAWALYTDNAEEKHDRAAALRYIGARAGQGINVLHSMLLSEAGWGNQGGKPWNDLSTENLNPGYWQEVDLRLAHANAKGVVCGLALAWGDKRKREPFAWRMFPGVEARKRYARYIAARYSAYDVYFIVSGEWHGEVRTRPSTDDAVRQEFIEIGDALAGADPHARMVAIHPMTAQGSVREFNAAKWMSFGDYQQNYRDLHGRVLESLKLNKPVVNSEYGYFLRDQSGDGVPDKDNSTSAAAMRHATWDIVMAGGYVVTGFGTTYFGGNRDPGPFDLDAKKNDVWEAQLGHLRRVFLPTQWWKLKSHDELVLCQTPRGSEGKEFNQTVPPQATYWCLADPGRQYIVYARGLKAPITLTIDSSGGPLSAMQFDPRSGERKDLGAVTGKDRFEFRPPDDQDWIVLLTAPAK